jgi:hypothetical protein
MDYLWFWFSRFLVDVGIAAAVLIAIVILMIVSDFRRTKGR